MFPRSYLLINRGMRTNFNFSRLRSTITATTIGQQHAPDHQSGVVKSLKTAFLPELFPSSSQPEKLEHQEQPSSQYNSSPKTLIRKETLILKNSLIKPFVNKSNTPTTETKHATKIALLDGPKGIGKSSILSQIVADAREKGFIVLFIPSARTWTDGPGFFTPIVKEELDLIRDGPSAVRYYDRPQQTYIIFKSLLEAHGDTLSKIPYTSTSATTEKCSTLQDLVSLGISTLDDIDSNWRAIPSLATDIFHETINQLCLSSNDIPFAIVIDDYYHMIGVTCMMNDRKVRLHSNSIRTIAQFFGRDSIENLALKITNGFVLLASENDPPSTQWRRSRVIGTSDFPLSQGIRDDPSGLDWLKCFRKRLSQNDGTGLHVRVPDCLPGELKAMCATFSARGLRGDQVSNRGESDRLAILAGGRGREMARIFATR